MSKETPTSGRLQLAIIALVFFGPLVVATWMYMTGSLTPGGSTNPGVLLEPIVNLGELMPDSTVLAESDGRWVLAYVNTEVCDEACRSDLYRLRQIRLMLGNDMDRVIRLFLHGDAATDTVFLEDQHQGLRTTNDKGLAALLSGKRPGGVRDGGFYLIDPLSNLVMYFSPDLDPADVVDDIEHLLELSRIG